VLLRSSATGTWSTSTPIPERLQEHHGELFGGKIYIAGGIDSTGQTTKVAYRLDPRRGVAAATAAGVVNGKIVVVGGERTDGVFDNHEVYDPVTNAWGVEAPMPTARHGLAAVTANGKIYVIGGGPKQGLAQTNVVEVWTP